MNFPPNGTLNNKINILGKTTIDTLGGTFTFDVDNHITLTSTSMQTRRIQFPNLNIIQFKVTTYSKWVSIKFNPSTPTQYLAVNIKGLTNRDISIKDMVFNTTVAATINGSTASAAIIGDYISVEVKSDRITFTKNNVFWFDVLNTLISTYVDWTTQLGLLSTDASPNVIAEYFRPYITTDITTRLFSVERAISSKWKHKSWDLFGDSITWYDGRTLLDGTTGVGYPTILVAKKGIVKHANYAISGASMARSSNYPTNDSISIDGLTKTMTSTDVVTIFAGTNDFKLNVSIGNLGVIGDTVFDDTKFYDAYRKLIEYILTSRPTIKIYLFTPLQRDNASYDVNYTNSAGHKLSDYVTAIKNIGNMYGLPVLDLFGVSGITKKTLVTYLCDGLHPNNTGYVQIADIISGFIETY